MFEVFLMRSVAAVVVDLQQDTKVISSNQIDQTQPLKSHPPDFPRRSQ